MSATLRCREMLPCGQHDSCVHAEAGIGLAYRDDRVPYWVLDLASRKT